MGRIHIWILKILYFHQYKKKKINLIELARKLDVPMDRAEHAYEEYRYSLRPKANGSTMTAIIAIASILASSILQSRNIEQAEQGMIFQYKPDIVIEDNYIHGLWDDNGNLVGLSDKHTHGQWNEEDPTIYSLAVSLYNVGKGSAKDICVDWLEDENWNDLSNNLEQHGIHTELKDGELIVQEDGKWERRYTVSDEKRVVQIADHSSRRVYLSSSMQALLLNCYQALLDQYDENGDKMYWNQTSAIPVYLEISYKDLGGKEWKKRVELLVNILNNRVKEGKESMLEIYQSTESFLDAPNRKK